MKKNLRIAVYPEDVCKMTGKSLSYARKMLARVRKTHNKQSHQLVTFDEVRDYLGITQEQVDRYLLNE